MTDPAERSEAQAALAKVSDTYVAQVQAADTIVLGVPMYNFGVPSALKAWIDRIARAGVTFKYTDTGPVGLLSDKKIIVAAARGGMYAGTPADTQTPYLTSFFNFLGLTDIEFVYAEGLAMGDADTPMNAAKEKLATLVN
jgi:FMN-dependent NADH-azoreductase